MKSLFGSSKTSTVSVGNKDVLLANSCRDRNFRRMRVRVQVVASYARPYQLLAGRSAVKTLGSASRNNRTFASRAVDRGCTALKEEHASARKILQLDLDLDLKIEDTPEPFQYVESSRIE